ncbi:MAG: AsmA family protein, partial [Acidobacteriaceae bacterium]
MSRMEELLSSEESGKRAGTAWRKLAIAGGLAILLVLALVLPPLVNLSKYRRSITASMSEALGRPVVVGGMQLRLLPMPGIVMSDFTVDEDPAFGYEPALHANSVVASLRLTSLWRGRLEVSRISLDEANLNLVRNPEGQWSIGSVLLRASQIPNAPTGERHAGARPRFPYIEASDARIDFRDGIEKKPFSLMNAEFSMWQASGDEWRLRLEAQPVRTDLELHLSDAGTLRVEGSLRRADNLLAMPVDLNAEWSGAQLGQVTRLLAGVDSGWRGDLNATTTIGGTGGDLQLQTRVRIANLRRQEFQPPNTVNVDATCRSEYHHVARRLDNITCFWPVGNGHLLLTGAVTEADPVNTHLQLEINQVPASFPVRLLGLMRANAHNVTATGAINGKFNWGDGQDVSPNTRTRDTLTGDAMASGVSLSYPGGALELPAMHFVAEAPLPPKTKGK